MARLNLGTRGDFGRRQFNRGAATGFALGICLMLAATMMVIR